MSNDNAFLWFLIVTDPFPSSLTPKANSIIICLHGDENILIYTFCSSFEECKMFHYASYEIWRTVCLEISLKKLREKNRYKNTKRKLIYIWFASNNYMVFFFLFQRCFRYFSIVELENHFKASHWLTPSNLGFLLAKIVNRIKFNFMHMLYCSLKSTLVMTDLNK